jgi:hypothetical protein
MDLLTLVIIVLVVMALGGLPTWGFHQYGYGPSGLLFIVIIVLVVLLVRRRGGPPW